MSIRKERTIILLHGFLDGPVFDLLKGKDRNHVFVLEGRPSLESSKSICRELIERNIKPTVIADNMAGFLFYKNLVKEVWISYQKSDDHGALTPVGGLLLGILSKNHNVPLLLFPAAASTKLLADQKEIFYFNGQRTAPQDIKGYVPLVEWIDGEYITKINPAFECV